MSLKMNIHRFVTHSGAGLANSSRLPFLSMTAIRRARNSVMAFWTRFHKVCLEGKKETKKPRGNVNNSISKSGVVVLRNCGHLSARVLILPLKEEGKKMREEKPHISYL